jgi:hypothetical protein
MAFDVLVRTFEVVENVWKVGKLEGWKVGRLEGWKVGRLEGGDVEFG